jgi:hypothetical protein
MTGHPPLAYLSCGAGASFPDSPAAETSRLLDAARALWVRDRATGAQARALGVRQEPIVAADLALLCSDVWEPRAMRRRGEELLRAAGLRRPVLCFQSAPRDPARTREIVAALERTAFEVALLPIGHCHGDGPYLASLCGERRVLLPCDTILDIMALIAASDLFVGTSLHGCLTALSFGVPFRIPPESHPKLRWLADDLEPRSGLVLEDWSQLPRSLEALEQAPPDVEPAKAAVYRALRRVEQSLG